METDFISKFKKAHASCREGPVCHHVERYLETVMKMIQDVKLKQRASLTIHIENIGAALDKENAEFPAPKKSHLNSPSGMSPQKELGLVIQEHISMTKYTRQSLHKMISNSSGRTGLPVINKENRNSLSYK